MIIIQILLGVLGGIIGGMGMGGGSLTIPILTLFLHFEQLKAQGINLVAFLPMSAIALIIHAKNKLVEFKQTWLLAAVGCVFSLLAALLAVHVKNIVLKRMFALFLIALAIWQIVEFIRQKRSKSKNN